MKRRKGEDIKKEWNKISRNEKSNTSNEIFIG